MQQVQAWEGHLGEGVLVVVVVEVVVVEVVLVVGTWWWWREQESVTEFLVSEYSVQIWWRSCSTSSSGSLMVLRNSAISSTSSSFLACTSCSFLACSLCSASMARSSAALMVTLPWCLARSTLAILARVAAHSTVEVSTEERMGEEEARARVEVRSRGLATITTSSGGSSSSRAASSSSMGMVEVEEVVEAVVVVVSMLIAQVVAGKK